MQDRGSPVGASVVVCGQQAQGIALAEAVQARLGVIEGWKHGPHQVTYRQVERTFSLVVAALSRIEGQS